MAPSGRGLTLLGAGLLATLTLPGNVCAQQSIERTDVHVHLPYGAEAELDSLLARVIVRVLDENDVVSLRVFRLIRHETRLDTDPRK